MKLCVINLRGLSAAHTGPYGNRWIDTPSLNALASQCTVFDVHLAAHPDAVSARWSWRTGCHRFPGATVAEAGWPDLLTLLHANGIPTALLVDASRPSPAAFQIGWESVRHEDGLAAVVAAGREALGRLTRSDRGVVWIELASLLPPWDIADAFIDPYFTPTPPAEEEDGEPAPDEEEEPLEPLLDPPAGVIDPDDDLLYEVIQTTYAAAITPADAALADLLDGLSDDVAVLVTSDHGQALGERGHVGPGRALLHREIVQVPLLLRLAGRPMRRRVGQLTLSIDIAPTIADLFGLPLPGTQGRSLLPLAGLASVPWRDYACLGVQVGDEIGWGMWTADWVLHLPHGRESGYLYVRPDDRCEINDVSAHHIESAEALQRTLLAYVAACAGQGPLNAPPLEQALPAATTGSA